MKTDLPNHVPLRSRLKKLKIHVDEDQMLTLVSLICACEQYDEFEGDDVYEFGPAGTARLLVSKDMDKMLMRLSNLPGGMKGLLRAVKSAGVEGLFQVREQPDECSLDEYFGPFSIRRDKPGYAWRLYLALTAHYRHLWYYHPEEIARADAEGRDPDENEDAYDVGAFNACEAIAAEFYKTGARRAR